MIGHAMLIRLEPHVLLIHFLDKMQLYVKNYAEKCHVFEFVMYLVFLFTILGFVVRYMHTDRRTGFFS